MKTFTKIAAVATLSMMSLLGGSLAASAAPATHKAPPLTGISDVYYVGDGVANLTAIGTGKKTEVIDGHRYYSHYKLVLENDGNLVLTVPNLTYPQVTYVDLKLFGTQYPSNVEFVGAAEQYSKISASAAKTFFIKFKAHNRKLITQSAVKETVAYVDEWVTDKGMKKNYHGFISKGKVFTVTVHYNANRNQYAVVGIDKHDGYVYSYHSVTNKFSGGKLAD